MCFPKLSSMQACFPKVSTLQRRFYKFSSVQARSWEFGSVQPASLQIDAAAFEDFVFLYKHQGQQALDFFRRFGRVVFSIFSFTRCPADMGAENVHDGLAQIFIVLHQMEEFVGTAQAHRVRVVPQVFDGILQTVPGAALARCSG